MDSKIQYDVIIIGGSYAGLSAAMALGRSRRNVLIIDSGKPCNATAPHAHNFLTQDGVEPSEIASIGKSQVLAYPTITLNNDLVISVEGFDRDFKISTASGEIFTARKILFSAGVRDLLPEIPGFQTCWGKSIIHCPYCHGYEFRDQPTGLMANGDMAFEFGRVVQNWTDKLTIFTNGASTLNTEQAAILENLGIVIETGEIVNLEQEAGILRKVWLEDGRTIELDALYAKLPFEQHCTSAVEMGCKLSDQGFIVVDDFLKTNVPGIYAAGDCITPFRSVATAVATGSKAGAMLNHEIIVQM
ncbi:MAG: NAD(P)/FAD-dependent oxidoreductase [Sphingobacteriales bacterium]|nr:MAG: NAD(P)/FAD-dependent oxidoreductase [Sphingobacteriales bacterium]